MASIGVVARVLNVSQSSLRRWEAEGNIPSPPRRPTGLRDYNEEHIKEIERFLDKRQKQNNKD
ncbi:helix-turn-helix domain-containing protein [Chloroflexota bacterium]